jgi:hypothetical protein
MPKAEARAMECRVSERAIRITGRYEGARREKPYEGCEGKLTGIADEDEERVGKG